MGGEDRLLCHVLSIVLPRVKLKGLFEKSLDYLGSAIVYRLLYGDTQLGSCALDRGEALDASLVGATVHAICPKVDPGGHYVVGIVAPYRAYLERT